MDHRKNKLMKLTTERKMICRNMSCSLIEHGQVQTSMPKAKLVRSYLEKIITRAKKDTGHNRRLAFAKLRDNSVVHKLFTELGVRYADHPGGYLRILKSHFRHGDNALMVVLQFVEPKNASASTKKAKSNKAVDAEVVDTTEVLVESTVSAGSEDSDKEKVAEDEKKDK